MISWELWANLSMVWRVFCHLLMLANKCSKCSLLFISFEIETLFNLITQIVPASAKGI